MRYSLRDIQDMLRSPLGRMQLVEGVHRHAGPLLNPLARLRGCTFGVGERRVAIIGSLGKTTTYRAVAAALGCNPDRRVYRNYGTCVASQLLRRIPGRFRPLEVGIDAAGQMQRYARLVKPYAVVVTSIASEHHRSLGTLERTRAEKAAMVEALPGNGWAILNGDDDNVMWMAERTRGQVITYGFSESCDVRGLACSMDWPNGIVVGGVMDGKEFTIRSRFLGRHMAYPLLAAIATAKILDGNVRRAPKALSDLRPASGRMQIVPLKNGAFLIRDDFKSTVESIDTALDALETVPAQTKLAVIGDVSEPTGPLGPLAKGIGRRLGTICDWVAFVGRGRNRYAAGLHGAGRTNEAIFRTSRDLQAAAEEALKRLEPGAVILVKGRYSQRLDRASLVLMGRTVNCDIPICDARAARCEHCPMLERGWQGRRPVV